MSKGNALDISSRIYSIMSGLDNYYFSFHQLYFVREECYDDRETREVEWKSPLNNGNSLISPPLYVKRLKLESWGKVGPKIQ